MRIYATNGAGVATAAAAPRRASGAGFSVSEEETARPAGPAAGLRTVGGIDALIALQGIEDATERRRHALKRGRVALDELKLGILGGMQSPATLTKLRSVSAFLRDRSGDAGLDGILGEIELRVEVEIAKMDARPA